MFLYGPKQLVICLVNGMCFFLCFFSIVLADNIRNHQDTVLIKHAPLTVSYQSYNFGFKIPDNVAIAKKYYMTPAGAGQQNGSNWENSFAANQKINLDELIQAGDVLYLGSGVYAIDKFKLLISSSGKKNAYKAIIGVDQNGLGFPILMGKMTSSGYGTGQAINIKANASYWYLANFQLIRVKRGITISDGNNSHLSFKNISISLSRYAIYISNRLDNFSFQNITMERYAKQGFRCQGGCTGKLIGNIIQYSTIEGLIADHTGSDFRQYQKKSIGMVCQNNCVNFSEHIDKINRDFGIKLHQDLRQNQWDRVSKEKDKFVLANQNNQHLGCPDGCSIYRQSIPFGFIFYAHGKPSQYIKFKNCVAMNHKFPKAKKEYSYWNGDGFVIEGGSQNQSFIFENTISFNNYDAGYDDKGLNSKYIGTIAFANKRNYRSWQGSSYYNCFSGYAGSVEDEKNGDAWWAGTKVGEGKIKIVNCTAVDNRAHIFSARMNKTYIVKNSILARTKKNYADPLNIKEIANISKDSIKFSVAGVFQPQFKNPIKNWNPLTQPDAYNSLAYPNKGYHSLK